MYEQKQLHKKLKKGLLIISVVSAVLSILSASISVYLDYIAEE